MKQYVWESIDPELNSVVEAWRCEGEMFILEIQRQDDDLVIGTVFHETPATREDPSDFACVLERDYESVPAAKYLLEELDRDAVAAEIAWEEETRKIEEAWEEWQRLND